jgi:hypothetical protein
VYKGDLRTKPDFTPFDRKISWILDKISLEADRFEIT